MAQQLSTYRKMTIFIIKLYIVHRSKIKLSLRLNCVLLILPLCPTASHMEVEVLRKEGQRSSLTHP